MAVAYVLSSLAGALVKGDDAFVNDAFFVELVWAAVETYAALAANPSLVMAIAQAMLHFVRFLLDT